MFELNSRYTLTMPQGTISESGRQDILRFIQMQRLTEPLWAEKNSDKALYLPLLPDDFAWVWIVSKGEYAGTFPKRVGKFYHKVHQINCPPEFLQELGNIARAHSGDTVEYTFDFVDEFNWRAGEYGDSGSCWWGSYSDGKDLFEANGGLAMRFYSPLGEGMARAWVYPNGAGQYIVFNGYGFVGDNTLIIARVLAMFLGMSYKKIDVVNHGESSSTMYINGGRGYMVGVQEALDGFESFDFEMGDGNAYHCTSCGDSLSEDDVYHGADDDDYCSDCYYERFGSCERCDETHWQDDLTYVTDRGDYCETCLDHKFTYCDGCSEYRLKAEVTMGENEQTSCDECRPETPDTPESSAGDTE